MENLGTVPHKKGGEIRIETEIKFRFRKVTFFTLFNIDFHKIG